MSLDVYLEQMQPTEVHWSNITHNLGEMASKCGLYYALWRPDEVGVSRAQDLIPYLERGIAALEQDPDFYRKWDNEDGWGTCDQLLSFAKEYLQACRDYPSAMVRVSR